MLYGAQISLIFGHMKDLYILPVLWIYIPEKIISWVLSETLEASHVVKCIEKAKQSRHIENPLIFHCDRGCQYVSEAFHKATEGMDSQLFQEGLSLGQCLHRIVPCPFKTRVD